MSTDEDTAAEAIRTLLEAGASAAAEILGTGLSLPIHVDVGKSSPWDPSAVPAEWHADGAVFFWSTDLVACLLLIPESGGLFPAPEANGSWSADVHGRMVQIAESLAGAFGADAFHRLHARTAYVTPLTQVPTCVELSQPATLIPLNITVDQSAVLAHVIGPLADVDEFLNSDVFAQPEPAPLPATEPLTSPNQPDDRAQDSDDFEHALRNLPHYTRSLLKVSVPLSVTLAAKKQKLADITRLMPGSIIQFDKSCDDVLELLVANETIAVGEAVKVNDNFGLRITSMTLPDERFRSIATRQR